MHFGFYSKEHRSFRSILINNFNETYKNVFNLYQYLLKNLITYDKITYFNDLESKFYVSFLRNFCVISPSDYYITNLLTIMFKISECLAETIATIYCFQFTVSLS